MSGRERRFRGASRDRAAFQQDTVHRSSCLPPARRRQTKASRDGARCIAWSGAGGPVWTPRDYRGAGARGLHAQPGRASLRAADRRGGRRRAAGRSTRARASSTTHPLLALLRAAEPAAGRRRRCCEALYGHLLVAGNAYLEAVGDRAARCASSMLLRPDRMKVVPGAGRLAGGLRILRSAAHGAARARTAGRCRRSCISTLFHPLDDHYGLRAARGGGDGARHAQCRRPPGTRRCSTMRRGPPARWSMTADGRRQRSPRTSSSG